MTPQELRAMRRGEKVNVNQQPMLGDGSMPMSEQQMMMMDAAGYNPMLSMGGTPDARRTDRWLETKMPEKKTGLWLTDSLIIEELAKSNLSTEDSKWCFREWREIVALAGGDGNNEWVNNRQNALLFFIKINRSVSDRAEKGLRDGTMLMTQNINQKSDVKMPTENIGETSTGGFLSLLRRGR